MRIAPGSGVNVCDLVFRRAAVVGFAGRKAWVLLLWGALGNGAFSVVAISTPQLQRELQGDGVDLGRGYLLLLDYNEKEIRARLQELLEASGASTWGQLYAYVDRFFDWI